MQDNKKFALQKKDYSTVSRTQNILSYLENIWKRPYTPSPETLKDITEALAQLSEPYQTLGITKIAEYLVDCIGLHFLNILATFQKKAESEGISDEENMQTLQGLMPELLPEMMNISKQVHIQSLNDLVTLGNITLSLYTLSQVETAEEAQSWLYELPILYRRQLTQEKLLANVQVQLTVTSTTTILRFSGSTSWRSSLPDPVDVALTIA